MKYELKVGLKLYKTYLKKKEISNRNNAAYDALLSASYKESQYALKKANNSFYKSEEAKEDWHHWIKANGGAMLTTLVEIDKKK